MFQAAYGVGYIPANLLNSFLKTDWELLDYTQHKMEYEEVIAKDPIAVIAFNPPEMIRSHTTVKYILTPGAGIDMLPLEKIIAQEQTVINSHANALSVAEHAWALLLAVSRKVVKYHNKVVGMEKWPPRTQILDVNTDIHGKSVGIVGYGNIGKKLEQYALAFDMHTMIFRMHPLENQYHYTDLQDLARDLDVLILACPLTQETLELVDKSIIKSLPSHTILVNVGRGELVNEKDLMTGLIEGKIRGAGLDVWHYSPYGYSKVGMKPEEFVGIPSLVISPHRAWVSRESYNAIAKHLARELDLIALGKPSPNEVDLTRGY